MSSGRIAKLVEFFISEKWKHLICYGMLTVMVGEELIGVLYQLNLVLRIQRCLSILLICCSH